MTIFFALLSAFLAYYLWSLTRRRRPHFVLPAEHDLATLFRSMAGLTWGNVIEGNHVRIVQNSAFFDVLLEDVAAATHHVHIETFLWQDGQISDRVEAALAARGRAGIEVRLLVDQRGALHTSPLVWTRLREAGCQVHEYHRPKFRDMARYNDRDHRKIAVVDGRIGYTFGHGVADMWGGTPQEPAGWRDTAARFEGPVVNALQAAFFENWIKTTGEARAGECYFPRLEPAGTTPLHVAWVVPRESTAAVQRLYYLAIAAARREIILQNPYFLPDRQARALFLDAVKRGVKIRIMLPTAETSDFSIVQHASHQYYGLLLAAGVEVYEHTRCGLHQKVMIVDGVWCSIGSTNFDPRSFKLNDEITVSILDRAIAAELRQAFEDDTRGASRWTLERWNARTTKHKLIDKLSSYCKREL
jgi:cardiolipin synthase